MKKLYAYKIKVGSIVRYIVEENKDRAHARFNIENDLGEWSMPVAYIEIDDMKKVVEYFLPNDTVVVQYQGKKVILKKMGDYYYLTKEKYERKKTYPRKNK